METLPKIDEYTDKITENSLTIVPKVEKIDGIKDNCLNNLCEIKNEVNSDEETEYCSDGPVTFSRDNKNVESPVDIIQSTSLSSLNNSENLPIHTLTKQGLEIIKLNPQLEIEHVNIVKREWNENVVCEEVTTPVGNIEEENASVKKQPLLKKDKPVSTGRTYSCEMCGRVFSQLCHLKGHVLTHTGARPFACKQCPARFNQRSVLNRHLVTHTDIRPFECEMCGKTFSQTGNLKKHMLTHTYNPQFECDICFKKFNLQCYLKKHMSIHGDVKKFECQICQKRFLESGQLKNHMIKHNPDKPYRCQQCPKAFKHLISLHAHHNTHLVNKTEVILP